MQLIFSCTAPHLQMVVVVANRFRALLFFLREKRGIDSAVICVYLVLPGLPIFCHSEENMLLAAKKLVLPPWLLKGVWLPPHSVRMGRDQKSGSEKY